MRFFCSVRRDVLTSPYLVLYDVLMSLSPLPQCPNRVSKKFLSSRATSGEKWARVPVLQCTQESLPCPTVYSRVSTLSYSVLTSLYPVLQCTHESVPVLQCIDESVPVLQCTHDSLPCPTMYCRVCTLCYNVLTSLYPVLQGID